VIVCDDGRGLIHGLDAVLLQDRRQSVRTKYALQHGHPSEADLVDYAFDRLSSTKRDIAQLVHTEKNDDASAVASGLYWIWNVIRSYRGLLAVRTRSVAGWYTFRAQKHSAPWELPRLATNPSAAPFPGTMIRIYLPLEGDSHDGDSPPHRWPTHHHTLGDSPLRVDLSTITVSWVGKVLRRRFLRSIASKTADTAQQSLWELEDSSPLVVLRGLQEEHAALRDGDILLLDMSGTSSSWDQGSVAALWRFFLELNYTSTVGRSAVVLWNVPSSVEGLFDAAIADANQRAAKIQGIRRIGLLVRQNGEACFHCGWPEAEEILQHLSYDAENDLDEIGGIRLSPQDRRMLRTLLTENSHLFEWTSRDRVRLRAWPQELQMAAWSSGIKWLNELIDKDASLGGALRRQVGGSFRLPSTGWLVKDFYSFGGLISNDEACARLGWLLYLVIKELERRSGTPIRVLVSVTRPVISLASHVVENYYSDRDLTFLVGSTTEDLRVKGAAEKAEGAAILITDVVSSGFLCDRVREVLPNLDWIGTVAILDTGRASAGPDELARGIEIDLEALKTRKIATGDVFALATRHVEKVSPESCDDQEVVVAIDPVNVCPIIPPEPQQTIGQPIWPYLERRPQALQVGHYHAGDLHHYVYYVNAEELVEATHPATGCKLLETIADSIVDLLGTPYDPERTVIMHPPRDTSYAEVIAVAVQRSIGALYRHVLHRDTFAGQRRFSSFVAHGIPIAGATVIVIDDGSNTGETLMGLLHAAASAGPARILAHVALSRMPLHKVDLFRRMTKLQGVAGHTRVEFAVQLSISAFNPLACPICRFRNALDDVAAHAGSLRRYARSIQDSIAPIPTGRSGLSSPRRLFHWSCASAVNVARLREAIQVADYDAEHCKYIIDVIKSAMRGDNGDGPARAALQDLAFVVCSEPELLASPIFVPFLSPVFQAACRACGSCADEQFQTLAGLGFHLMIQLGRKATETVSMLARSLWKGILGANSFTIVNLGRFLASCLADVGRGIGDEQIERRRACTALAAEFLTEVGLAKSPDVVRAIGKLFVREVSASLEGQPGCPPLRADHGGPPLFHLASEAASKFFWHASENVRAHIHQGLQAEGLDWDDLASKRTLIADHVFSLLVAFGDLQELQQTLCRIDQDLLKAIGQKPDASAYWESPAFTRAMASFAEALTSFGELAMDPSTVTRDEWSPLWNRLSQAWDTLKDRVQPAISEIFPNLRKVIYDAWKECESISGLPSQCIAQGVISVGEDVQCFLPRTLLIRFLNIAMENLKTSAYAGWTSEELSTSARVVLSLEQENNEDGTALGRLRLSDNGRLHHKQGSSTGSGHGLGDIETMAKPFGARLSRPVITDGTTVVELSVFLRGARA
jgi:dihydroneopterin aldolase